MNADVKTFDKVGKNTRKNQWRTTNQNLSK